MPYLVVSALPPQSRKSTLIEWMLAHSTIKKQHIGKIMILDTMAKIELDPQIGPRIGRSLIATPLHYRTLNVWWENELIKRPSDRHFDFLRRCLEMEAQAELTQSTGDSTRPRSSLPESIIGGLKIADIEAGVGNRMMITLVPRSPGIPLPWSELRPGSCIQLLPGSDGGKEKVVSYRGIIAKITKYSLQVALPATVSSVDPSLSYGIVSARDEISRNWERQALARVQYAEDDRLAELRDLSLGIRPCSVSARDPALESHHQLDAAQLHALQMALKCDDFVMIHGPPGTGKTTTLVAIIQELIRRGDTVLVCAPSNLAVDNLFERLLAVHSPVIRIGHPLRLLASLQEHSLDSQVANHPDYQHARQLRRDALAWSDKAEKQNATGNHRALSQEYRREADTLFAEARDWENRIIENILDRAQVICATLHGAAADILGGRDFAVAIIDEAGQATEPACWIPIQRARKVIMAGDHCQLPPTIISPEAEHQGYGITLFERLIGDQGDTIACQLTRQYRMSTEIMNFSSQEFYHHSLIADASVAAHRLSDLASIQFDDLTASAIHFIDTSGAHYDEELEPQTQSFFNPEEADLVRRKIDQLVACGVPPRTIVVISPYSAQVRHLRDLITDDTVEIASIDGFQGRENEVVIISLVRSNRDKTIGFLADLRRMNVALTRARRKLIVIGDSATISVNPFYRRLLDYFASLDAYHGVWDEY